VPRREEVLAPCGLGMVIMRKRVWRDDPRNSRDFEGWLKANALLGSILAIGILGMAFAVLYSVGRPDKSTEFSSVTKPK
jgi:hypothetical protein